MSNTWDVVGHEDAENPEYTVLASFATKEEAFAYFEANDPCEQLRLIEEEGKETWTDPEGNVYLEEERSVDLHPFYAHMERSVRAPDGTIYILVGPEKWRTQAEDDALRAERKAAYLATREYKDTSGPAFQG